MTKEILLTIIIKNIISYFCFKNTPAFLSLFEMIVPLNFFQTTPTKELFAILTRHFIASINFWNTLFAMWTWFCAIFKIYNVHLLLDKLSFFAEILYKTSIIVQCTF
jgi:hypothetical protein